VPAQPPPIVAVVGATAVGKSDLAVDLARAMGGEVVNTDAFQLYRGMDIGTAKLPPAARRGVPHHLLDVLDVQADASVAQFQRWARDAVGDCRARGVVPVLVGGSALYTRAVLDRFEFPGTDPAVRTRLEEDLAAVGSAEMHRRLASVDPAAAASILPGNGRRVVRALEVVELTGRPFAATLPPREYADPASVQVGVTCPREDRDARIERRVRRMWDDGLVEEVRALEARGLRAGRTASRALGYRQVLALLDGSMSEQEAFEATVVGTRRFARRQDSWFHKDPRVRWVDADDPARVELALEAVGYAAARVR
jgi:tRNA dimethylallyltransferase